MKVLFFILFSLQVCAKTTVVAVIDTGLGIDDKGSDIRLCNTGHRDFTRAGIYRLNRNTIDPVPLDRNGHGTHIAGLINKYANLGKNDFCLIIVKSFDTKNSKEDNGTNSINAIRYATDLHVDFINYSAGGIFPLPEENVIIKKFLNQGGKFIAAAGNEHSDLARQPYYPAISDKRIVVVGNITEDKKLVESSNYGFRVNCWENGYEVNIYDITLTGTSQATAIVTGKMVAGIKCNKKITVDKVTWK